ncbi:MAG: hypothetical protein BYD32DRAFT_222780 [Podila humilis]|nr:MAG: hypothetical protein BYD32DRAFT_222780 [Podila humilis]
MDSLDSSPSTQTLNELLGSIAEHKQLDDEHLMALMHLCGQQGDLATTSLMNALRLVDIPNAVEKLVANRCQRSYYKVKDLASDLTFTCRPSQRHCTCDRFVHGKANKRSICVLSVKWFRIEHHTHSLVAKEDTVLFEFFTSNYFSWMLIFEYFLSFLTLTNPSAHGCNHGEYSTFCLCVFKRYKHSRIFYYQEKKTSEKGSALIVVVQWINGVLINNQSRCFLLFLYFVFPWTTIVRTRPGSAVGRSTRNGATGANRRC